MPELYGYLQRKSEVLAQRRADFSAAPEKAIVPLTATSWVAGGTGARPTRMGATTFVTDSAPSLAGHALGPTAPEMLLGALASCLVHTYLIQAALLNIPLEHVEVDVEGRLDMAGVVGLPSDAPPCMEDIRYRARLASTAEPADLERMHAAVEESCPVLNTLRRAVPVARLAG